MIRPRLAVIGAGHLGRIHARLAQLGGLFDLVAVCDPLPAARESIARDLNVRTCSDHRQLLGEVEAVIVATPTTTHAQVACDFLRNGVHAFVEKPLAISTIEAQAIVADASQSGVVLQVGHVERFNPAWMALGNDWSDALYFDANRASTYSFRSIDIGVVHDLMIHDLDLVLSQCQAPVVDIQATLIKVLGPHEDIAHARLEFADGRVALLRASRVSLSGERCMQIFAPQRHAIIDFATPSTTVVGRSVQAADQAADQATDQAADPAARQDRHVLNQGAVDPKAVDRVARNREGLDAGTRESMQKRLLSEMLPISQVPLEKRNAIADEQADWLQAIRFGRSPRVNGTAGLRVLQVIEQILACGIPSAQPTIRPPQPAFPAFESERRKAG